MYSAVPAASRQHLKRSTLALLVVSCSATAGLFGPSNHEECLLDEMRGQLPSMGSVAMRLCDARFPREQIIRWPDIRTQWAATAADRIGIIFTDNQTNHQITKITATFTIEPCDSASKKLTRRPVTFTFTPPNNTASVTINNAEDYQCLTHSAVYGIKNR